MLKQILSPAAPVASVASSSILSSSNSSLDQLGGFALQSGPLVGPARPNPQTATRPSSNTQNAPIMASSTMSSSSTSATSMRQILPKDKARVGQSPGVARPTQVTKQFLALNPNTQILRFVFQVKVFCCRLLVRLQHPAPPSHLRLLKASLLLFFRPRSRPADNTSVQKTTNNCIPPTSKQTNWLHP